MRLKAGQFPQLVTKSLQSHHTYVCPNLTRVDCEIRVRLREDHYGVICWNGLIKLNRFVGEVAI